MSSQFFMEKLQKKYEEQKPTPEPEVQEVSEQTEVVEKTDEVPEQETVTVKTDVIDFHFAKGQVEQTPQPKTADEFYEETKKRFGNDPFQLFGKIEQIEQIEKETEKIRVEKTSYEQFFNTLPPKVSQIVQAVAEGKDYEAVIRSAAQAGIDYSKSVTSYSKDELIKLFNDDLTDEDLEDMEEKSKHALYKLATENYNSKQREFTAQGNDINNKIQSTTHNFLQSAETSVTELKTKIPEIKTEHLKDAESMLKKGLQAVYFNQDGGYKKEAAETLIFGTHGLKIINQLKTEFEKEIKRKEAQAISKAKEEISSEMTTDKIERGSHTPAGITGKQAVEKSMPFLSKK